MTAQDNKIRFCRNCGAKTAAGDKFCRKCGFRFDAGQPAAAPQRPTPAASPAASQRPAPTASPAAAQRPAPAVSPAAPVGAAASSAAFSGTAVPGEIVLGALTQRAAASAAGTAAQQISAGTAAQQAFAGTAPQQISAGTAKVKKILPLPGFLLSRITALAGGLGGVFRNPKALLSALVFGAAWILLPILQEAVPDSPVLAFLSWLTYARGGLDRAGAGVLGGILGKVTVASALSGIVSGGLPQMAAGLGRMFSRDEKGSIGTAFLGALTGAVCYMIFAGIGSMGAGSTMAGISGALLCLRSMGSGKGFFSALAESATSRVTNGVRTADPGRQKGMLSGMTAGFAVITALSALF